MFDGFPENRHSTIGTLRRARVEKIDDSGAQQIMRKLVGLKGDQPEDVYRAQPHGFSSHPPAGSEGLFLALGGRSDRLIGIGFEHKDHRPKGSPAGTAMLYDDKGNVVFVKGQSGIVITARQGKVTIKPADDEFVYLGGDGSDGMYDFVLTESGPSVNVKAKIG